MSAITDKDKSVIRNLFKTKLNIEDLWISIFEENYINAFASDSTLTIMGKAPSHSSKWMCVS